MPALLNPRREAFARAIAAGFASHSALTQAEAYRAAGYNAKAGDCASAAASRLLRTVKPIADRVRELVKQAAKRKKLTVESIVDELEEARTVAKANDQAAAMVAASGTKAKLLGLSVDRTEIGRPGDFGQAHSTAEIVDAMIRAANPGVGQITDDMREMAAAEMQRHARALTAIAAGDAAMIAAD